MRQVHDVVDNMCTMTSQYVHLSFKSIYYQRGFVDKVEKSVEHKDRILLYNDNENDKNEKELMD